MARKKMRPALQRNNRNNQSSSEGSALTITSLDQLNLYRPQVAPEIIQARNCPTKQCALFTFLTIDPVVGWRIVAVPLQCPDHASHPNFYDEPQSIPGISYSRARMRRQLRNRLLSSITIGPDPESTTSTPDSVPADNESLERLLLEFGDDKAAKTSKSKKAKRKERQRKKLLGGGSAEAETASETSVLASPESETEGKDNAAWPAGSSPHSPKSSCCSDPVDPCSSSMSSYGDETIQIDVRISDYRSGKKVNQVTVLNSSSRHGNAGNSWWTTGKENNHPVWQKVQKQAEDEKMPSAAETKESMASGESKEHSLGPKQESSSFSEAVSEASSGTMSPKFRAEAEPVQESHVCSEKSVDNQLLGRGDSEGDVKQKSTQKWVPIGKKANLEEVEADSSVETVLPSSVENNDGMRMDSMDEGMQAQDKPLETQTSSSSSKLKIGKEAVPFFPSKVRNQPLEISFDSDKIMLAVHNACLMQLESEAVHAMTGGPVAEFENLLYACCPEIARSSNGGLSSDLTLKRLWQWYEQPGCFGVEVKGLDYTSTRRFGMDNFQFRAYFVPYISAVQLFTNRKQQPVMAPQSWNPAKDIADADDVELIFEYFESAQPAQRRPFLEKIQELIRGGGPGAYGDHTKLGSVNLQDLDPRSWYSVAWYPIYRIPDGNFRAAFLTYHSLSNLVHRTSEYNGVVDSCIVSPAVGLHSYNAQGECWFQMNPWLWNHQTAAFQFPGFDPARIMMERLRTLEEVALAMSRAVVNKGMVRCENKHHDYEFFVRRSRY